MGTLREEERFLRAYEEFSDAIFRHCYFRVYDRERARELMQEAFTRTWEQIGNGVRIQNMRAFLYRVANNLIIDEARKKKELSLEAMQEQGFTPSRDSRPDIHTSLEVREIFELLQKLDPKYREVVIMRYINNLSPREIADILGENANVISVHIHRGIKQVRELLSHHE